MTAISCDLTDDERAIFEEIKRVLTITNDEDLIKLGLFKCAMHADVPIPRSVFLPRRSVDRRRRPGGFR